ncbi:hypothetical protein BTW10_16130 [Chromohalobacter japonicus]|uniref:Core-binding (CB) domain-containing protein n=1 Tax=Chromohalobacter japonicus TaxID=223900 RepID=A0A1Q8T8Y1_9GAMM|nr:hypothetical protein [Chromohalobacter japonicus]OLO10127.1 hypothetical protein BTW10_16130 [Chromohalobacter japonicus]
MDTTFGVAAMAQNQAKCRRGEARYESKARRILLPEFRFVTTRFLSTSTLSNPTNDFNPDGLPEHEFDESHEGYYPNFPVLIQGNGEPWDIGNLYLTQKLASEHKYESRTYRAIADHLLDYLRYLEDEGLDYLHFPKLNQLKVTYQYRRRLVDQVQAGEVSVSTASARINAVIQFYRSIMHWKLIDEDLFMLEPFKDVQRYINTITDYGIPRSLRVKSHNLAITTPRKQPQAEYIYDDGELRPLTMQEQELLLKSLLQSSREYQLIFYFALFTGARTQSIGTLRIKHLKGRLDGDGYLRLPIGMGTEIDTKKGKRMQLLVPGWLVNDLLIYSKSQEVSKRRIRSYYGDIEDNYMFLTLNGNPYYTSKKELLDRRDGQVSRYVGYEEGVHRTLTIQDGGTIRRADAGSECNTVIELTMGRSDIFSSARSSSR